MNLNVVYELKERMETAVIAGVNLIQEDFRLKRAVEQMAPLAALSPVFKKIYVSSGKLLEEKCEDREGLLLDTLSLVDAVCTTQGSLQTEGEILWESEETETVSEDEIPYEEAGKRTWKNRGYKNFPYSVMAPVVEAFRGTGGGRYAVVRDAYEAVPELFEDYRIETLMVHALGDSYADMADMVQGWLERKGTYVLPLIKQGFQPDGKREMARRIQIMDAVAAGGENEFYRSLLSDRAMEKTAVTKEVKEAAIRALRHEQANEQLLLDLLKTETGKMKEQVLYALSFMSGGDNRAYWEQAMKKKPVQAASYLANTSEDWASDMIADALMQCAKEYETAAQAEKAGAKGRAEDAQKTGSGSQPGSGQAAGAGSQPGIGQAAGPGSRPAAAGSRSGKKQKGASDGETEKIERRKELVSVWFAAEGKHSEKLCQCYETVYRLIPEEVPDVLVKSLIREPDPALCEVAKSMYQKHREPFAEAYGVMVLLTETKEKAYEELSVYFSPGLREKLTKKDKDRDGIFQAMERLEYNEEKGYYQLNTISSGPVYREYGRKHKVEGGLDFRWYGLFMNSPFKYESKWKTNYSDYRNRYDRMVAHLYRPDIESLKREYGAYFYDKALKQGVTVEGLRIMKRCGWTDYKGLLAAEGAKNSSVAVYHIRQLIEELPMSNTELADELDGYIKKSRSKAVNGIALLEKWRDELRDGQTVERL